MPTTREIKVFNIAKTTVDRDEVRKWLDYIGAENFEIPEDGAISNPALLVALAAKRCYMSFEPGLNPNVTKVRTDLTEFLDNLLKQAHGSVLEHSVYTFAIEGITRVFTGEMNRHRAGWAISEGSMRYIRLDNIAYWEPTSLVPSFDDSADLSQKKDETRELFRHAFRTMEDWQEQLREIWGIEEMKDFSQKKKLTSMFRRLVGMGVCTGGVWSGNLRALRHVLALRTTEGAEEEIREVFQQIGSRIIDMEPELFGDFNKEASGWYKPKYEKV